MNQKTYDVSHLGLTVKEFVFVDYCILFDNIFSKTNLKKKMQAFKSIWVPKFKITNLFLIIICIMLIFKNSIETCIVNVFMALWTCLAKLNVF